MKGLAMQLEPTVYIGKNEMGESVLKEMDDYLTAHEMVKVKIQESSGLVPKDAANEAAAKLGAEFVQAIGRKFTLYRENKNNKQIFIPGKK